MHKVDLVDRVAKLNGSVNAFLKIAVEGEIRRRVTSRIESRQSDARHKIFVDEEQGPLGDVTARDRKD